MKYKCDMVRDLMPLCLDKSATEASEQTVVEHMAECSSCEYYYDSLDKELFVNREIKAPERKYTQLANKIRRRKTIIRAAVSLCLGIFLLLCVNYTAGYRFNPQTAAATSGRLNYKSKLLGSHEWNNWKFYFYDSYSCYDVVLVEKSWHGWVVTDTCLSWPKWFNSDRGIEMAGNLGYWSQGKGIQLFPFIASDERIKTVEVTVFGETKQQEVSSGKFTLITFESPSEPFNNETTATAYDATKTPLYTLTTEKGYWIWNPVTDNK